MSEIFMGICRVGKIDLKCEHQTDTYWDFGLHCPLCRENHMSKWWLDNRGNKLYYLHCDEIKNPGVSFNEVLKAYPENSN